MMGFKFLMKKEYQKQKHPWVQSLNHAIQGLIHVFKHQRNMKVHFIFAILLLILSVFLKVNFPDFLFLLFAVVTVLISEMFNSALEMMMDVMSESYHPLVRLAKDVSAGAVLISTGSAVIVGYLVLSKYLSHPFAIGITHILASPWYVTLIALLGVFMIAITVKIFIGKGTPFYGGMPSVHSAVAFSIATIVTILSRSTLIMVLTFFMAIMVGQSRMEVGAHRFREVLFGAFLGILFSLFIFQFVYQM